MIHMRVVRVGLFCSALAVACFALSSCGGGGGASNGSTNSTPAVTSVSVTCHSSSVVVGQTNQCSDTVQGTGSYSSTVSWSVNGVAGGNSTVGTISSAGLYTAPGTVPSPASVAVTATSQADSSKSGNASLTVKLGISVSPQAPSIEAFHSEQFTATITGVSNTAVTWSVNQIQGGSNVVGTIDSTGLYTAPISLPSPASVDVEATSVADPSQSASATATLVADASPPQVVSVSPADKSTGVSLAVSITITFNERLDPSTLTPSTFTLSQGTTPLPMAIGYDPTEKAVTFTLPGLLAPLTTYNLSIGTGLKDLGGNALAAPFSSSFTTVGGTSVPSSITAPVGLDPTSLNVVSLEGQQTTPAPDGTFTSSVRPQGTTAVAAMVPGEAFGLMAISIGNSGSTSSASQVRRVQAQKVSNTTVYRGRWQVTASPLLAQTGPQSLVLNFQTTAESLLFLSPALFTGNPQNASAIETVIAAEPKTQTLADALEAAWNEPYPLEDPNVADAYASALTAILNTLTQKTTTAAVAANVRTTRNTSFTAPNGAASVSGNLTYHSFDVCCVTVGSFGEQNSMWSAAAHVIGPSLQNPNGNYVGWYLRTVQLSNSDPASIIPGVGPNGSPDSPPLQPGEGNAGTITWFTSNSFVDEIDLSNILQQLSLDLLKTTGITSSDLLPNTISVPQPANGGSATYLLRFYSGGGQLNDSNEATLVGELPQGTLLSQEALGINLIGPVFGILSGAGILPTGSLPCFAEGLVSDGVFASVPSASFSSTSTFTSAFGSALSWMEFAGQDLTTHVAVCASQHSTGTAVDSLADFLNMQQDLYSLTKGVASDALAAYQIGLSAGKLTGVVADLLFTVSPVDTAYISIAGQAGSQVASIAISPASPPNIGVGSQQPFSYVAKDAAGNILSNVNVTWTSSNIPVATVDSNGLATAVSAGTSTITVTAPSGASASAVLTVNPLSLDHLLISPSAVTIHTGQTLPFSVSGVASNGATVALGAVTWASSASGVASVDSNGVVTGASVGNATISATSDGKNVSAQVSVIADTVNRVVIAPATGAVAVGGTLQLSATALDSAGNPISGASFTWSSTNSAVAKVDSTGLSTGLSVGQATINATSGGVVGSAKLTVAAAVTPSISQVLPNPVLASTSNQQLTINGSGFQSGAIVTYYDTNNTAWPAKAASVVSSSQIVDTAFDDNNDSGTWKVTVTNPGESASTPLSFTVGSATTVAITSISPATPTSGSTAQTVTISGSNFQSGATVSFTPVSGSTFTLTPSSVAANAIQVSVTLNQAGSWALVVTNPGPVSSMPFGFTVAATTPTGVTDVSPGSWSPVFTVGDSPASTGFQVTNEGSGTLTGTMTASTTSGGQWLTAAGHTSYGWTAPETINVGANPAGLSAGTYTGSLAVSSPNASNTVTIPVTMTIYNPLKITTTTLPDAVSGQPYNFQLEASGGTGTRYTWSLVSGTLPVGISFSSSGLLSGTPGSLSGSVTETLNIAVTDSLGHQTIDQLTVLWREELAILQYSPSNFQFVVGSPYTAGNSITLQAVGGTPPYTWSATGLPPGLSIVVSSGLIGGTPTQPGTFTSSVTVKDSAGRAATASVPFSVVLNPISITTTTLTSGTVGVTYDQVVNAQGGSQNGYSWSVQGSLPPGLTGASASGGSSTAGLEISGTPTTGGTYTFTVVVKDSLNDSTQQSLTIVINTANPPQITTNTLTLATVGSSYTFAFTATGGAGGYKWSFIGASPDPSLQLSSAGVLSGTSTVPNDCPSGPGLWIGTNYPSTYFQLEVTDSSGQSAVRQFCLPAYYPTPHIAGLTPTGVTIDGAQHTITVNGTGFRSNAYIYDSGTIPTTYVSAQALSFVLSPAANSPFSAGPSGPYFDDGTTQLSIVQPYSYRSNPANLPIYDPVPTVSSVTAVLNDSTQACTAGSLCQIVVSGSGLVYDTSYTIGGPNLALAVAANPSTPVPWSTITTVAFTAPAAGTYTLEVTNPNQPGGGAATAVGSFTVN